MAIQDDFTIDTVDRKITYSTAFVDDRPPTIYTVNELYSFLQDTFDEPGFLQHSVPMSAQTPTQYTLINGWFIDDESMKALYGGSIQTSGWVKSAADGITQLRWQDSSSDPPGSGDIGVTVTGGTSTATGVILATDATRQVVWVRNSSAAQFQSNENITGAGVDFDTEVTNGFVNGETIWSNLFSVGSLQTNTEIYVGQEDDYQGGRSFHDATNPWSQSLRRIEKIDEWWDADVDFTASPNLLGGLGHFDILVKTQEAGSTVDGGRLAIYARQFGTIYSHFELTGGVGNFVVPFASTGSDLNSQEGPYTVAFDNKTGNDLEVGDVLENDTGTDPVGRLRAVVTAVTDGDLASGTFDYYLIGENQPLDGYDRTLVQLVDNTDLTVRGDNTAFQIAGTPTAQGPATAQGITITFADNQIDVDEDSATEEYACTIDCNNVPLADVYRRMQFLTSRGNQDGTTPDLQDELLPSAAGSTDGYKEAGEFYRAVGDIIINYDNGVGVQVTEGDFVENDGYTASGVVVSVTSGTTGVLVLTQVKGTFANDDLIAANREHGLNHVQVNGTPTSIVDNTGAPFGSFAGGRWFVAQGVVLTNVPGADANNWETTDLAGIRRAPPTVRTITFAGLVANDRAGLFEVNTAGGTDIRKNQNGVGAAGASAGATSIPLDSTVALDVPSTGWIRVVDTSSSTGEEFRYEYSSISGTTVTLRSVAPGDGTLDAGGSSTLLVDTGVATNFGTNGNPKVGMMVRNTTTGGWARVLRKVDNNTIETTPLTTGTWATGESYELNTVVVALVDADTVYFPFVDDTATGASIVKTIKFVENTDLVARARFSDPDVGGTRILPFELTNITLTDANLTVTAIRTEDTIATP